MSASVERDIAIIATRAPSLPEALPNPITGIAGSIFMLFRLIRPTILTAISSPSHAAPHLRQLPAHTTRYCLPWIFQFIPHPGWSHGNVAKAKVCGRKTKRKQSEGILTDRSIQQESDSILRDFGKGVEKSRIPCIPKLLTTHFGRRQLGQI